MKYTLKKDYKGNDNGQLVVVYGIHCDECSVPDISCDRSEVVKLLDKCNRYGLDEIHLKDVIEDFLNA